MVKPGIFDEILADPYFNSNVEIILRSIKGGAIHIHDDIPYSQMRDAIIERMTMFQREGSNWSFNRMLHLDLAVDRYTPIGGSSYIPLPKALMMKKAIVNMKNNDDECFKWSVTRALHPVEHNSERISKILRIQTEKYNWDIKFPVSIKEIGKFEKQNPNICINVFGYENKNVYPLRISKYTDRKTINLLLIDDDDKQHYCCIKA